MQTLDYLVIYHDNNSIYTNTTKEAPITIIIKKEADAKEKLCDIKYKLKNQEGVKDFKIIGIFKL